MATFGTKEKKNFLQILFLFKLFYLNYKVLGKNVLVKNVISKKRGKMNPKI